MTGTQTGQPNPYQRVAERLGSYGINRIAIIDDAYDNPTREDFEGGEDLELFFAEVDADPEARAELANLGYEIANTSDISDEMLGRLFSERQNLTVLKGHCNRLFHQIDEKQSQLKPLYDSLKHDLGLEVDRYGKSGELTDLTTKVIFIDYYLGPGMDSYEVAKRIARETYGKYAKEPSKPLIILMSSKEISEETIAAFRDESGLLGGTFYFVDKRDFSNKDKLHLKIGAWAMALPYSEKIQNFINGLQAAINKVSEQFIKDIRKLSVDDYAYIQKLSLQEDGHPLGDYMVWLYSSYFGRLLFEAPTVREQQEVIDKMTFEDLPPSQVKPTLQLAEIYRSALFASVDDAQAHPRDAEGSEMMYLHLGDVFIKEGETEVWMVINAQCDLAFAPDGLRQAKPERSILMISGRLRLLGDKLDESARNVPRTELFERNGATYRILWNTKKVISPSHGEFKKWKEGLGYKREVRLRLPFALEVQRAFAADLTRVGMPVAPPIYQPVTLQLICMNEQGKAELLHETASGAYMFFTRDGELCVLGEDFVSQMKSRIAAAKEHLKRRVAELKNRGAGDDQLNKHRAWVVQMEELEVDYDSMLRLRIPFALPIPNDSNQLGAYPLTVSRRTDMKAGSTYRSDQPLTLVISAA
jgi:hypothetical protein